MINLFDSLMERMEGRKYQNYFSAFCPFETHKSPALLVYEDGYICLSCRKTGTLEYLNKKIGSHFIPKQRFDTVSRVLPRWKSWEEKYGDLAGISHFAHRNLTTLTHYQTYLKRRKIDEYLVEGLLGYLDGWIVFPVFDGQRSIVDLVVRSVQRKSDTRYVVAPGSCEHRPLYVPSWERVNQSNTVYVVFGIIDSIALHLAGLPVVTGVTGKSLHPDLLKPLRKEFIIIPDDGEEKEAHRLANQLGWRGSVKELDFPDGCKDPDNVHMMFGNEKLVELIGV